MTDGSPCAFGGCGGSLDGGYCDTCGRAPLAAALVAGPPPGVAPRSPVRRRASPLRSSRSAAGHRPLARRRLLVWRATRGPAGGTTPGLACARHRCAPTRPAAGRVPAGAPPRWPAAGPGARGWGSASSRSPPSRRAIPWRRSCRSPRFPRTGASAPSAAARSGAPATTGRDVPEGFCRQCRTRFSFTPRLGAGDMVGGQYQVLGALAHGGLGWIYLARDRAVSDRWVVLKGLLDAASEEAALAAVAERRFLAALDHPNIVRIHNFVAHEGAGYIVMDYIGGKSLKAILADRRDATGGRNDPMPVDERDRVHAGRPAGHGVLPRPGPPVLRHEARQRHAVGRLAQDHRPGRRPPHRRRRGRDLRHPRVPGPRGGGHRSDGRVRPVHRGPHVGRAAPRLPRLAEHLLPSTCPGPTRNRCSTTTSRCTASCSRRPPRIRSTGSSRPTRWPSSWPASFGRKRRPAGRRSPR